MVDHPHFIATVNRNRDRLQTYRYRLPVRKAVSLDIIYLEVASGCVNGEQGITIRSHRHRPDLPCLEGDIRQTCLRQKQLEHQEGKQQP